MRDASNSGGRANGPLKRWLHESGSATPFERDILRTGVDVDPPPEAQALVMAALMAKIGAASAAGGGAASAATAAGAASAKGAALASGGAATGATAGVIASSAASTAAGAVKVAAGFGLLKSVLLGAGAAAVMIGGYTAVTSKPWSSPPPSAATSMVIESKTQQAPLAPKPSTNANAKPSETPAPADTTIDMDAPPINLDSLPTVTTSVPPPREAKASSRPSTASVAPRADEADEPPNEETKLMGEARATLRSGNAAGALAILGRVPNGPMAQEREALTIEALYRTGNKAAASERAKAFLKASPGSIHASKLEAMIIP